MAIVVGSSYLPSLIPPWSLIQAIYRRELDLSVTVITSTAYDPPINVGNWGRLGGVIGQ